MAQPKKFDTITIVGLALAGVLIWYGFSSNAERARREAAAAADAQKARDEDLRRAASAPPGNPNIPPVNQANPANPANPIKPEAPEPVAAADVSVAGTLLELTFSSKGATLTRARLPGVSEDPAKKDGKGLDLLIELQPGKRTFGIPSFTFEGAKTTLKFDGKERRSLDERVWELKGGAPAAASGVQQVVYTTSADGLVFTKTFTLNLEQRWLRCDLTVQNQTGQEGEILYELNGPQGILPDVAEDAPPSQYGLQAELAARDAADGKTPASPEVTQIYAASTKSEEKARTVSKRENLWGAVKNRFHMATLVSVEPRQLVKIIATPIKLETSDDPRRTELNVGIQGVRARLKVPADAVQTDTYSLYVGPADDRYVDKAEAEMGLKSPYQLRMAIQFCDIFSWRWPNVDWLARGMMIGFNWFYSIFGSFGLALVATTVLIKLLLHPIQRKMMRSMSKMQKLKPELDKIKAKYASQPQTLETRAKMSGEQRDLMAKNQASPASGCLPMLVQIPVLSALYGIFSHAFDMRGASFLWINDLSQPDHMAKLSFWPHWLNMLPLLYMVLSFVQTQMAARSAPKSDDPQQKMQSQMAMFMPVMIGLMWYGFMPAGLMLYFVISSLWSMGETWYLKRFVLHDKNAPMPTPTGL